MHTAKWSVALAGFVVAGLLTSCAVSPIGCPIEGHRVDRILDRVDTPSIATIVEDEPGTCESGEPATAMRHYRPDTGTPPADVAAALVEILTTTGWADITPLGDAGSYQRTYETTIDSRRYVATLDDSRSEVWIYLSAV